MDIAPIVSRDYILSMVSEEDIYFHFFYGPPRYNEKILSPIRSESVPSAIIYPSRKGGLYLVDFTIGFKGDVFDMVQYVYNTRNFKHTLEFIADEMNIPHAYQNKSNHGIVRKKRDVRDLERLKNQKKTTIHVSRRPWNKADIAYWSQFFITEQTLSEYLVIPVQKAWVNGSLIYSYKKNDPCYAYYYGEGIAKLYFPLTKGMYKFLGSSDMPIQGLRQLPETYDKLVITKSTKDIMVFREIRIPAIAPHGEAYIINGIEDLLHRFSDILVWYDFDYAGLLGSGRLKRKYGLPRFTLTNGRYNLPDFGAKDPAEFAFNNGPDAIKDLTHNVFEHYFA